MAIAEGFRSKWKVKNCLGAIVKKKVRIESRNPEILSCLEPATMDTFFWNYHVVDASYKILFCGMECLSIPGVPLGIIESRQSGFPKSFFFVGSDEMGPRGDWLRVPSGSKDQEEEIKRAMKPAEIALEIMYSRFAVLKTTLPVKSMFYAGRLGRAIYHLHNYFLKNNPAYADDADEMMKGISMGAAN